VSDSDRQTGTLQLGPLSNRGKINPSAGALNAELKTPYICTSILPLQTPPPPPSLTLVMTESAAILLESSACNVRRPGISLRLRVL
jgi:hypothetical protein